MGKKNKKGKKDKCPPQSRRYDQSVLSDMADSLEEYLEMFDTYVIRVGADKEKYEKNVKVVKKAIKNLRMGNGDAVFDDERYEEMMHRKRMGEFND